MFKVETYQNPLLFYNRIDVKKDELHITSIPILAMHIKKQMNYANNWNVWIYHHFYKALYPRWTHTATILEQKRLIREIIKIHYSEWDMYGDTLLKQVDHITESFRTFMELEIKEIKGNAKESKLEEQYIKLYMYFMSLPQVKLYWEDLEKVLQTEQIDKLLDEYNEFYIGEGRKNYPDINRIYFYSIDYMEPGRVIFLQRLSNAGYEIIFRIPYETNFPKIHECWKKIYTQFVPFEDWISLQSEDVVETSQVKNFLEGKENRNIPKREIFLHEVAEPILFKSYLNKNPMDREKLEYIACQDEALNNYFRDEIEKTTEIGHFFETPLGRFIEELYKLKITDGKTCMTYNTFINMMTSGIIIIMNSNNSIISGERALSLLNELKPYMEGVKNLEEILDRMNDYKEVITLSKSFDDEGQIRAGKNRVKRYLQNPFRAFGFVQLAAHSITINQLIELSDKLILIIQKLIVEFSPIQDMQSHIVHLKAFIVESKILEKVQNESDVHKGLIESYKKFFALLNARLVKTEIYDLKDMNDYISLQTKMIKFDEADGDVILIKGLEYVLGTCVNGVESVYLCDLSTINMGKYINSRMERIMIFNIDQLLSFYKNTNTPDDIVNMSKVIKISNIISTQVQNFIKYNLSTLFTYYKGEIHIGWIKNMNSYDTKWYLLSIIENLCETNYVEDSINLDILEIEKYEESEEHYSINTDNLANRISPLAWEELNLCDKRFYYSNILQHHPIYREDFTQRQLFAHLCKMVQDTIGGKEQVEEVIKLIFPQWNETLKENMINTQEHKIMANYQVYDNVEFPKAMLGVQVLSRYSKSLKNLSDTERASQLKEWINKNKDKISVNPGIQCDRCPHQLICVEGELGIERER